MNTSTKPTKNLAECGNKSKPLLANRLLKYRAWVKEQNRIIKVFGFNEHLVFEQTWDSPSIKENIFEIESCHIIQFTGFLDQNGKEIYEGDILEGYKGGSNQDRYYKGFLQWNQQQGGFVIRCGKYIMEILSLAMQGNDDIIILSKFEIIGNVFENPDLLQDVH